MKTNWTEYALMTEDGLFWNRHGSTVESLLTSDLRDMARWNDSNTPAELVISFKNMAERDEKMKEIGEIASRLKLVEITASLEVHHEG